MAQVHRIGVGFGPTIAQTQRNLHEYYTPFTGVSSNIFYQFEKGSFFARSGIGLIQKGFNQELIYFDEAGNLLGKGALETVKHNYVNALGEVGGKLGDTYFGFASVGARFAHYNKTIVSSAQFRLIDGSYVDAYKWKLNYLEPWDISMLAKIGAGYKDEFDRTFFVSLSYDYGITKVRYNELAMEDPFHHVNWTLQIGFTSVIPNLKE